MNLNFPFSEKLSFLALSQWVNFSKEKKRFDSIAKIIFGLFFSFFVLYVQTSCALQTLARADSILLTPKTKDLGWFLDFNTNRNGRRHPSSTSANYGGVISKNVL